MRGRRGRRFRTLDCPICIDNVREANTLKMRCCSMALCKECMQDYCSEQIKEGIFKINCPFTSCDKKLDHGMVMNNLTEVRQKKLFEKMITESMSNSRMKTCPGCSKAEEISKESLAAINSAKNGWFSSASAKTTQIKCNDCSLKWCFSCHAPWHSGMTCSVYLKGDRAFSEWMRWRTGPAINAHFCPKCRIPIQRSTGCPSMVCSYCNASWCYDCGQSKNWDNTILGPHYSKMAFKGCLAPNYLFCHSLVITYFIRIGFLLLMLAGIIALGTVVLVIGVPILPLALLGMCTTLPLFRLLGYEKAIQGVTPVKILNSCISHSARFVMLIVVFCLFILVSPLVILSITTLIPLLIYSTKRMKTHY